MSELAWVANIEEATLSNDDFRRVLFTRDHAQLTVMHLRTGEEIGWEMHEQLDQFLRIEQGEGKLQLGRTEDKVEEEHAVRDDWAIIVPAGTWHNVVNTGSSSLRLYSIYSPPEHPDGTIHRTKAEADAAEHDD